MKTSLSLPRPQIFDGKKVAESVYRRLKKEINTLVQRPKLVVVIVGDDPASQTYVRNKARKCQELGLGGETLQLPESTSEETLLSKIRALNRNSEVCGILVQLPLPKHIDKYRVMSEINPLKDVDGLHPENVGLLWQGKPRFLPCTPAGIVEILKHYAVPHTGKRAVILGRSEIVGKPMISMMLGENTTVTACHSKTVDLKMETNLADILIVAAGQPRFIDASMVSKGATVIDVGIHRINGKLVGDVDFDSVKTKVAGITPVPGGVGPMTIAMLMQNVVRAARLTQAL